MSVVECSGGEARVIVPGVSQMREPQDAAPEETTAQQPNMELEDRGDPVYRSHPPDIAHESAASASRSRWSQDNALGRHSQTQSPLLRIDRSVLSEDPTTTQKATVNDGVQSALDVCREVSSSLRLLSLPDRENLLEVLDATEVASSTRPVAELQLLHLPDEPNDQFLCPELVLPSVRWKSPSTVYAGAQVADDHDSTFSLPLLHFPHEANRILVENRYPVRTDLPLLRLDRSHPTFIDPPCLQIASSTKSRETPCTQQVLIEGQAGHTRVVSRRKRRQAKHVDMPRGKQIVTKTTETQTDPLADDPVPLVSDGSETPVQQDDTEVSLSGNISDESGKALKLPERPVGEWSPAVAAFNRQIEVVEADLIDRQPEERRTVNGADRAHSLTFRRKGLTAVEIEMLPVHAVLNKVSSAVQTDAAEECVIPPSSELTVQTDETPVVTTSVRDAATQSELSGQDASARKESDEQSEEAESVVDVGGSKGSEESQILRPDLSQVLAPHLFFGLQFPRGPPAEIAADDHGFISVVDIPASSMNDLPSVDTYIQKEALEPVMEERSMRVSHHTVDEGFLPVNLAATNEESAPEELALGTGDALTSRVLSGEQSQAQ